MACDIAALMLYSIDALPEAEVASLADHVVRCRVCKKRLTNREEMKQAIIAACRGGAAERTPPKNYAAPAGTGSRRAAKR